MRYVHVAAVVDGFHLMPKNENRFMRKSLLLVEKYKAFCRENYISDLVVIS